jgi:hypothetical protein
MATNFQGNLSGFDANEVKPQDSFDVLPAGWYPVVISESEFKPTKNGEGQYLHLVFTVIEGPHENRKIFDRLNLDNPNQTAVEIAQRALSAICHAVGVLTPSDSTELHDKPLEVKLSVRPAKDQYEASNEVKGYRARGTGTPAAAAITSAAKPAAAKQPPWKKAS